MVDGRSPKYIAKPSASSAALDFSRVSRWFSECYPPFLLPTSHRLRFDFSYEGSSGVSVADLEKVETLVSGLLAWAAGGEGGVARCGAWTGWSQSSQYHPLIA